MDIFQTYSSDQKLIDDLFNELPKYYSVLREQLLDSQIMKIYTLSNDIFFVVQENAAFASQMFFGNEQQVCFLTSQEVLINYENMPINQNKYLILFPLTSKYLEEIIYHSLTQQFIPVEIFTINQQKQVFRQNFATPGNVTALIEYCQQLLSVQTYKAIVISNNIQQSIIYLKNVNLLNLINLQNKNDTNYNQLITCLFQCQISEVAILNIDQMIQQKQLTELQDSLQFSNIKTCVVTIKSENYQNKPDTLTDNNSEQYQKYIGFNIQLNQCLKFEQIVNFVQILQEADIPVKPEYISINILDLSVYMQITHKEVEQLEFDQIISLIKYYLNIDAGRNQLYQFMILPLNDLSQILLRQQVLTKFIQQNQNEFKNRIKQINGFSTSFYKLFKMQKDNIVSQINKIGFDLYTLYNCLQSFIEYIQSLFSDLNVQQDDLEQQVYINEFNDIFSQDYEQQFNILKQITLNFIVPNSSIFNTFENQVILINPNKSAELVEIFEQLQEINNKIQAHYRTFKNCIDCDKDNHVKLSCTIQNKLSFKLPFIYLKDLNQLQSKYDIVFQEKKNTGLKITTAPLRDLNQQFLQKYQQYQEISQQYSRDFYVQLTANQLFLSQTNKFAAVCDIINAYGQLSKQHNFQKPEFSDLQLQFENSYDPVLINRTAQIVKNTFSLEKPVTLITGANSGGKTHILKMIGNCQILAQIGLFVPGVLKTRLFDKICLRFGSGDDLAKNLSTFMNEMVQLSGIFAAATPQSLVLIDELGRGTSAGDGFGLSAAFIDNFLDKKAVLVTHLHELVHFYKNQEQVEIFQMRAEIVQKNLRLLYKLEKGADRSHGIAVARLCGLDEEILRCAEEWEQSKNGIDFEAVDLQIQRKYEKLLIQYQMGIIDKEKLRELM